MSDWEKIKAERELNIITTLIDEGFSYAATSLSYIARKGQKRKTYDYFDLTPVFEKHPEAQYIACLKNAKLPNSLTREPSNRLYTPAKHAMVLLDKQYQVVGQLAEDWKNYRREADF